MNNYGIKDNRVLIDIWLTEGQKRKTELVGLGDDARQCTHLSTRQCQILPELVSHAVSAFDLLAHGWNLREFLYLGSAARSLFESRMLAAYVLASGENAERLYKDGLIDIRDIFRSLGTQSEAIKAPVEFSVLLGQLQQELNQLMMQSEVDSASKHLSASAIADAIGKGAEHRTYYQFLSKFSHASAVTILTRNGENWKEMIQPILAWIGCSNYILTLACISDAIHSISRPEVSG